jgi:hypothetical protein
MPIHWERYPKVTRALKALLCRRRGRFPPGPVSWWLIRMLIRRAFSSFKALCFFKV